LWRFICQQAGSPFHAFGVTERIAAVEVKTARASAPASTGANLLILMI
jgi:hypothetical protein